MLSEKNIILDLKHYPGVMIGKEEMEKFIDFVETISQKDQPSEAKAKVS